MVLEAGPEIGHTWRSRWDSLTLFTPAQHDALPGMPFPGPPDTYPTKDPVADYLQAYAAAFDLPVRLNARVTDLSQTAEGFEVRTQDEVFRARQVVVATGPFQVPFVPPAARRLDALGDPAAQRRLPQPAGPAGRAGAGGRRRQLRVPDRRRARREPPGRPVDRHQAPRGCRSGWLARTCSGGSPGSGLMRVTVESRLGRRMSSREFIIGSSRRRLQEAGVRFRPAVAGADGRTVRFADGTSLDVGVVIWATGYRPDYSWIDIPGVTRDGKVVHRRGVTDVPGLYFLGLSWQHTRGSALLGFVHDDAAYLAGLITSHARAAKAAASRPASQRSA